MADKGDPGEWDKDPAVGETSIDLIITLDRLKEVLRENPVASGGRRERTAEHSWHLAVSVVVLGHLSAEPIDVEHAAVLALIHDIPEIFVGDTFVYDSQAAARHDREAVAMAAFGQTDPRATTSSIVRLWEEYEHVATPEGRFVMAVDVVLPVILNHANPDHSSWSRYGIAAHQVLERIDSVEAYSPRLAEYARKLVCDALGTGVLRSATETNT